MASPTHVASNATVLPGGGTTSVSRPSGVTTDDVIVAAFSMQFANDASPTIPAGWTAVRAKISAGSYSTLRTYYRVVQSGDGSSDVWGFATNNSVLCLSAWRGCDTTTPIQASSATSGWSSNTTSFVAPSVTATAADTTLICCFAGNSGAAVTYSSIGTLTERANQASNVHAAIFSEAISASGATGTRTVTSSVSQAFAAVSLLLQAAGGGGGGSLVGAGLSSSPLLSGRLLRGLVR